MIPVILLIFFLHPLGKPSRVTSAFGESRITRFHMGMDFSTNHRVGIPVHAVDDGEIIRIKVSYYGLGKTLYLRGRDGRIYVYGHLERFSKNLERMVRKLQFKQRRYFLDLFPDSPIRVKKGEIIGYTGESGAGPPHLHFEIRKGMNLAINPHNYIRDYHPLNYRGLRIESPYGVMYITSGDTVTVPEKFDLFVKCSYFKELNAIIDNDTVASIVMDSIPYNQNHLAQLFYLYSGGYFSDACVRLTGYDNVLPPVVKKSVPEINLSQGTHTLTILIKNLKDIVRKFQYTLEVSDDFKPTVYSVPIFTRFGVMLPDGNFFTGERTVFQDYYILKVQKEKGLTLKFSHYELEIPKGAFPWDFWIGIRRKGDTLEIKPDFPPLLKSVKIKCNIGEIYKTNGKKITFIGVGKADVWTLGTFFYDFDTVPPEIRPVKATTKKLVFKLGDNLSGILGDSISLYIDDHWVPADYDIDNNLLIYNHIPVEEAPVIKSGRHKIKAIIYDRALNKKIYERELWLR